MTIAIIDYKAGNIRNVQKIVESFGFKTKVISRAEKLEKYSGIILPGVGSFRKGMESLNESGLSNSIKTSVKKYNTPIMGICLGMHLIGTEGDEGGKTQGLGLIKMEVKKFILKNKYDRIPHMGWNDIFYKNNDAFLMKEISTGSDFYFAHSYHVILEDDSFIAAKCNYIYDFVAAIEKSNIFATQFHPEKSQIYGQKILENFLEFCSKKDKQKC